MLDVYYFFCGEGDKEKKHKQSSFKSSDDFNERKMGNTAVSDIKASLVTL